MSNLSGIFMFFASDLARIDIQAAIHLRLARGSMLAQLDTTRLPLTLHVRQKINR